MSLPDALELAASELSQHADAVRDANGDPDRVLDTLSAEAANEVLCWLLGHDPDAGEELAIAWSESEQGSAVLQATHERALPKPGRKALRRALHRLRSRGVDVNEGEAEQVVARLPDIDEALEVALLSPLDRAGTRMAYLVASHPAGGARIYEALIDDLRGIVEFRVYDTGRSKARKFLREVTSRANTPLLDVGVGPLLAMLRRCEAVQAADRPAPRAWVETRSQLRLERATAPPADEVVAQLAATKEPERALEALAERVRGGKLGPWPPLGESLRGVVGDVREGLSGKLIVSGATREARVREVLSRAAAGVFGESFSATTAARLRETAYVAWRAEEEDEARECLAGAAAFEAGTEDNPVALAFIEVILAPLLDELERESQEESSDESRVVTP